jgi:hypothetical protein
MDAAAITVDGIVEADVGTIVMGNDIARFSFFEDLEFRFGWLTQPFD